VRGKRAEVGEKMRAQRGLRYKDAGVDIAAGDRLVRFIGARTKGIGGFSGLFAVPRAGYRRPLLVASTDGVGTKLLIAQQVGRLDTIGIDLVAMVVNDLVTCGARPLFFLDYYAVGALNQRDSRKVLSGIFAGCKQAGCRLLGGETAELPGLYRPQEFDLAGFGVGIVDRANVIDGRTVRPGDLVIGLGSSGLHSNGYSLARKVLLERRAMRLRARVAELGETLGEALLRPTVIYSALVVSLLKNVRIKAIAHITGGGIPGNLPRVLPRTVTAVIRTAAWVPPPIFSLIERLGPVSRREMFRTFNMGIGMILVLAPRDEQTVHAHCRRRGVRSFTIGEIIPRSPESKASPGTIVLDEKN
jgi:phosphoribosylformylglycinamidine cyclo-ligase